MDPVLAPGETDGSWTVDLPAEEVPPELPEPCLGINFARDGMQKRDWLALVAVHSDSWLYAVAFYYGAKLDLASRYVWALYVAGCARRGTVSYYGDHGGLCPDVVLVSDRLRLFRSINQHPTLYEIVTGKHRPGGKEGNKRKRVDMVCLPHRCPENPASVAEAKRHETAKLFQIHLISMVRVVAGAGSGRRSRQGCRRSTAHRKASNIPRHYACFERQAGRGEFRGQLGGDKMNFHVMARCKLECSPALLVALPVLLR